MTAADRQAFVRLPLPPHLAGLHVEAVDHEAQLADFRRRLEVPRAQLLHDLRFAEALLLQFRDVVVAEDAR
jgi:hypothetical protein